MTISFNPKVNLLNLSREELIAFFVALGEKPFRASQIIKWVHQCGVTDFTAMTNLSLKLRTFLSENAVIVPPKIVAEQISLDGTRKWLLQLSDDNYIETVFIPEGDRGTLCISSQVGCALCCDFCATGKLGFKRNLNLAEIIGQLYLAVRKLSPDGTSRTRVVTNVVFMGMGEPLLNCDNVISACDLMLDDLAYGLSKYRVTVSTAGVVPAMWHLREKSKVALAVSLHAANDETRSLIMPINKKYPLKALLAACREYYKDDPRRAVTIEYIMIAGLNDSIDAARELVVLLRGLKCKVNLIPFNSVVGLESGKYRSSSSRRIEEFRDVLLREGLNTITRKSRGQDIAAACGQLAGRVEEGHLV